MLLQLLKNFDVNRLDLDDLVELASFGRTYEAEYALLKLATPEWVGIQLKSLRREIASRDADRKEKLLRELRTKRSGLRTTEERRAELDKEIEALQAQVS